MSEKTNFLDLPVTLLQGGFYIPKNALRFITPNVVIHYHKTLCGFLQISVVAQQLSLTKRRDQVGKVAACGCSFQQTFTQCK